MNDFIWVLGSILFAFFLGFGILSFMLRGFIGSYLKAFRSGGILLRVHKKSKVQGYFVCATPDKKGSGLFYYKDGEQRKAFLPVPGSVIRVARVWWADIDEESTAPYSWDFIKEVREQETNEEGVTTERTRLIAFLPYDNSATMANIIDWALMRPQRKLFGLGIDFKTLLIVLGIIILGVVVFMYINNTAGAEAAAATI